MKNAWRISQADVKHAGESDEHQDLHALNWAFLIDSSGTVRWQSVGDKPVLNIAEILDAARENLLLVPKDDQTND
jgi:hypothetical protein